MYRVRSDVATHVRCSRSKHQHMQCASVQSTDVVNSLQEDASAVSTVSGSTFGTLGQLVYVRPRSRNSWRVGSKEGRSRDESVRMKGLEDVSVWRNEEAQLGEGIGISAANFGSTDGASPGGGERRAMPRRCNHQSNDVCHPSKSQDVSGK